MSLALLRSSLLLLIKLSSSFTIDVVPSPAPAEIIFPVPSIWKKIIVVQSRNNIFLISQKNFWLPSYWAAGSQPPWRAVWDLSVGRGSPRSQELHQLAWWRRLKAWKSWKMPLETGFGGHCPGKKFLYLAGLHAPPVRRTGAGFIHIMADDFRSSDQILQVLSPTGKKVKMTTIMMTTQWQ